MGDLGPPGGGHAQARQDVVLFEPPAGEALSAPVEPPIRNAFAGLSLSVLDAAELGGGVPLKIPFRPDWHGKELLVRVFTSLPQGLTDGPGGGLSMCFGDVGIALQVADFDYTSIVGFGMYLDADAGTPRQDLDVSSRHAPTSTYLLLCTPIDNGEDEAARKLDSLEGWALGHWDRNVAYGLVAEFTRGPTGEQGTASPSWENPANSPLPLASRANWDQFMRLLQTAAGLDVKKRQRAALALRWFRRGCRSKGSDAILSFWIALEVAFAEDDDVATTLRTLKRQCMKSYSLTEAEVENKTSIGKLFGLRGRIVHEGWGDPIHYDVLKYMQLLLWDLFADAFLGSSPNRAPGYYERHGVKTLIATVVSRA